MPTFLLTETVEAVVRYTAVDSDGRGLQLGDVMRSAPSGGTMNRFEEWYGGVNWYLRGIDLRLQLGAMSGRTKETVTGTPAEAKAVGARSQLQVQF
jgi:phosphate-selective porin